MSMEHLGCNYYYDCDILSSYCARLADCLVQWGKLLGGAHRPYDLLFVSRSSLLIISYIQHCAWEWEWIKCSVTYGLMFMCEEGHISMLGRPVTSVLFMSLFSLSLWYGMSVVDSISSYLCNRWLNCHARLCQFVLILLIIDVIRSLQ